MSTSDNIFVLHGNMTHKYINQDKKNCIVVS